MLPNSIKLKGNIKETEKNQAIRLRLLVLGHKICINIARNHSRHVVAVAFDGDVILSKRTQFYV